MRKLFPLIFLILNISTFGQSFDRQSNIPVTENGHQLRFPWAGGINYCWISSIDLNQDGKDDLFLFDRHNNRIQTFLNNGDTSAATAWDYAPDYALQFPPVNVWAFLYDYNCDGKADFFTFSSASQCPGISCYKNISTSGSSLQWQIVDSCITETFSGNQLIIFTNSVSLPHFTDWDNDGDMDILGYNTVPDGRIFYHKNYSMEDYGVCDSLDFKLESLCLGNFALKIGGTNTVGCFHCPCRVSRNFDYNAVEDETEDEMIGEPPSADQSNAAQRDDTVSGVYALDTDGDGNKELLFGDIASLNTLMVHNSGIDMDTQDSLFPHYDTPAIYRTFHYHAYIDVDNDNKKDLLVMSNDHENKNGIWRYKNTNTTPSPLFNFKQNDFLQGEMMDAGDNATPVLTDYDGDGLLDIISSKSYFDSTNGTFPTGLLLYKNTGTATVPSFDLVTEDYANLTATNLYVTPIYPAFGDLDNDGDVDMLLGREDGTFHYYENTAGAGNPPVYNSPVPNYMNIDIGKFATPQLYDIDKDGMLDLITGGQRGFLYYFKNHGTVTSPLYNSMADIDTLGCINLQAPSTTDGYTVPFLYDSAGTTHLLVAYEKGNINKYDQIDGNLGGCFHQTGTVYNPAESTRIKFNISVSGGDLNGDGLTDIIVGQATGGQEVWYQHNPNAGVPILNAPRASMEIYPNPVSDNLLVKCYNTNKNSFIRIIGPLGQIISEKSIADSQAAFDASAWSSGIYLVTLNSSASVITRKFVK